MLVYHIVTYSITEFEMANFISLRDNKHLFQWSIGRAMCDTVTLSEHIPTVQ